MQLGIDTHKLHSQVAAIDGDNLQDKIRLPNDRLSELVKECDGSEAAIKASDNYCSIYEIHEYFNVTLINPSRLSPS